MNAKQKILSFLDKQGFYVVLALCLIVISVTAVLSLTAKDKLGDTANQTTTQDGAAANYGGGNMVLDDVTSQSQAPATEEKQPKLAIARPVEGDVIMEFAADKLLYNSTLKQWTTHEGIDIASGEGTPVKAVLAGTVEAVKEDALMGQMVTISHENGYKSTYANLAKEVSVAQGDKVKKDQEIGKVGKTALCEFEQESHMHFEFTISDKKVNPMDHMSGIKVKKQ